MKDVEIIGMLKSYVQKSLVGVGALKGAPCKIQSITDGDGFHTVKFEWTDDAGTSHTSDMIVNDGSDIASITQDGATITVTLSDGTAHEFIVPTVQGPKGDKGDKGDAGEGLPEGGTAGQVLVKESSTDYDMEWKSLNIPSKTSDLTNDSGFITKVVNDLVNYYLKSETYSKTEVDDIVTAIKNSRFEVVATLPTTDIKTNVIYLVPKDPAQTSNVKDEYINLDGTTSGWEKIGDTEIDLSGYVTTQALNTALAAYTTTADLTTLLAGKQDTLTFDDAPTENSNNPVKSGGVFVGLAGKADKVSGATNGNFAGLNANGNLTDSGKKASDFATATNLANYINENGAINQFDITLSNTKSVNTGGTWSDNAFTYRGLTYTVNADNIVITGTPTDNSFFYLLAKNIPAGRYTFGGLKDAANIIWDGGFWLYNGSVETAISTGAAGNKNDFTVDLSSYTFDRIKFGIKRKSNTLTNDTITLFIRKADINIDVNAPYAKTNRELTEIVDPLKTQFDADHSIVETIHNEMTIFLTDDAMPSDWSNLTTQQATDVAQALYDVFKKIGGSAGKRYSGSMICRYKKASDDSQLGTATGIVDIYSNVNYNSMLSNNDNTRFTMVFNPYGTTAQTIYALWGNKLMFSQHGIDSVGTVMDFDKRYTYNTISTYKG